MNKSGKHKGKCPICKMPVDPKYRPFCSERCQQLDLNKWLSGGYSVPAQEEEFSEYDMDKLEKILH